MRSIFRNGKVKLLFPNAKSKKLPDKNSKNNHKQIALNSYVVDFVISVYESVS